MSLLRNHLTTDINTGDPTLINEATDSLIELINLVNVKVGIQDYVYIPSGQATIHQAWSGDMLGALQYLAKGQSSSILGYWAPDKDLVVGSDVIAIPKSSKKPVLAHLFMDYLMSPDGALTNFNWTGYQPPVQSITPDGLINDGLVPDNLTNAVLTDRDVPQGPGVLRDLTRHRPVVAERLVPIPSRGVRWRRARLAEAAPEPQQTPTATKAAKDPTFDRSTRRLWPLFSMPGTVWLILLFIVPFYGVFAVAFGQVDFLFNTPIPAWNPLHWQFTLFREVLHESVDGAVQRGVADAPSATSSSRSSSAWRSATRWRTTWPDWPSARACCSP